MKTVTLPLPEEIARQFEALPPKQKQKAAMLAALIAQSKSKTLTKVLESVDKQVKESGLTEKDIEELLSEIS